MQKDNKRIAKNALFLYVRMFITMAVSLFTVRIVLNALSVDDYGLYSAVGGIILSFSFIASVLDNASQRFFSFELGKGTEGKLNETFSTVVIIYLLVGAAVLILAETIGLWFLKNKMTIPVGRENAALWVYQFALASFLITIIATPFRAMIIAQEKMDLYAYLSIFDAVSKLIIAYTLFIARIDRLILYAVLLFTVQLIYNLVYYIYCRKTYPDTLLTWLFDITTFKSVFSYSSWTLFGTLAGMCNTQGINIVLNLFFGPVANAAYSIASQVYHAVGTFGNSFYTAVKPSLIKNYASGDFNYVNKLFVFSSKSLFSLLSIIAIPLIVCTEEILQMWLGQVSDYMVIFTKLSLVYIVILTISYPITAIVQAGGNVKMYHALVDGFALLTLPIVIILFKLGFDAKWAYIVSATIFGVAHLLRIYVMKKVFPLFDIRTYLLGSLLPMILIFIISYFAIMYVKSFLPNGYWWVLFVCAFAVLFVFVVSAFILFSKNERRIVLDLMHRSIN